MTSRVKSIIYPLTITKMDVRKVKITSNGRLEVHYIDFGDDIVLKGDHQVHPDMRAAMNRLVPFLCDITEQREADKYDWSDRECEYNTDLLKSLSVSGITISGDDGFEQVIITGRRTLSATRKVLNLNTPQISLDSDEAEYERLSELQEAVDAVSEEAKLYVKEQKYGVIQQEFNFEAEANADDPFGGNGEAGESDPLQEAV